MHSSSATDEQTGTPVITDYSQQDLDDLFDYHPIMEKEYVLPTPMMQRCYEIIRERVWARRTGLVLYGPPRVGKTRCSFAVKELLLEEFPRCYVTRMSVRRASYVSGAHICRAILDAEDHVMSKRQTEDELMRNVLTDIEIKIRAIGGKQYVLIIDEIQLLNNVDLQQLVCIHNALEERKIRMTTISFAQPEIQSARTALMASKDRQIIARFLSEMVCYGGCGTVADLRALLRCYDESSEFPEGSGWSYTRFCVPTAFEHGFRLQKYAQQLWLRLNSAGKSDAYDTLPMEHTCLSIEYLLIALRKQDCSTLAVSKEDLDTAIARSELKNFLEVADQDEELDE